jgi:hypothetical protein
MRESEDELLGLAYHLRYGGDTFWTCNALAVRETSTLWGMIRRAEHLGDRRHPGQPQWRGPERRRTQSHSLIVDSPRSGDSG